MRKFIFGVVVLLTAAMIMGVLGMLKCERSKCVGHLSKRDTLLIERITGRRIIGDIDTTMISQMMCDQLKSFLESERKMVKHAINTALDFNVSEDFSVVHFFYDSILNCHYDCPDYYVWLSNGEVGKLRKHIRNLKVGDSIIIEDGDTIHRKVAMKHIMIESTLSGSCSGSCNGYTTTLLFNPKMNNIVIHNHHQYFCQYHTIPGLYEKCWVEFQKEQEVRKRGS